MQITLSKEVENLINTFSAQHNISQAQMVERAIYRFLEDVRDLEIAKEAYEEFLQSGGQTTPAKQLFDELGL
ncbi:DUF6290 family protein [Helicobacter brantae]|uniref:CopG family transcriptional regulator n=1 Tax=Helicobacter brantae TaxID=375927 RepID=A0A3D8J3V2_9HELI|nr:DUF6290 family protein [Helicobacter brantae]RDU72158.1 hypothetical protein CQA58_00705 [Helicobacter brantae]